MKNKITLILTIIYGSIQTLCGQENTPLCSFAVESSIFTDKTIHINPASKRVAYGTNKGVVKIGNMVTGKDEHSYQAHQKTAVCTMYSPDGNMIVSGGQEGSITIYDVRKKTIVKTFAAHEKAILCLAFSLDGTRFYSAGKDNNIKGWDLLTGTEQIKIEKIKGNIKCMKMHPNGTTLVISTSAMSDAIRGYNITDGKEIFAYETGLPNRIDISPDGFYLAIATSDKHLSVWDLRTNKPAFTLQGHLNSCNDVAFSPDGKTLASASDDRFIILWDVETKTILTKLRGHTDNIISLSYSKDGKRLASGSIDNSLKIWNVNIQRNQKITLEGPQNTAIFEKQRKDDLTALINENRNKAAGYKNTSGKDAGPVQFISFTPENKKCITCKATSFEERFPGVWKDGIDDAMYLDGLVYFFRGYECIVFDPASGKVKEGPKLISELFPGVSYFGVDATVWLEPNIILFFKGKYLDVFFREDKRSSPETKLSYFGRIDTTHTKHFEAALPWPDGKVYFFDKGTASAVWTLESEKVSDNYGKFFFKDIQKATSLDSISGAFYLTPQEIVLYRNPPGYVKMCSDLEEHEIEMADAYYEKRRTPGALCRKCLGARTFGKQVYGKTDYEFWDAAPETADNKTYTRVGTDVFGNGINRQSGLVDMTVGGGNGKSYYVRPCRACRGKGRYK